jgi:hypothetical protein
MRNQSLPQDRPLVHSFAGCPSHEIADLALEIFSAEYGIDIDQAARRAFAEYPALLVYAQQWDVDAAVQEGRYAIERLAARGLAAPAARR